MLDFDFINGTGFTFLIVNIKPLTFLLTPCTFSTFTFLIVNIKLN